MVSNEHYQGGKLGDDSEKPQYDGHNFERMGKFQSNHSKLCAS